MPPAALKRIARTSMQPPAAAAVLRCGSFTQANG